MKKHLRFIVVIAAILAMIGCQKQEVNNDLVDIWNGYENYKDVLVQDLFAGQHIPVGTVRYEFTIAATFDATYTLNEGWYMSESHLYAGDLEFMPVTGPGNPKIGKFPYKEDHDPAVNVYTYSIPLSDLPPGEEGFVCAAHCVVDNDEFNEETAWAFGSDNFSDRSWGWYTKDFRQANQDDIVILYAVIQDENGNLILLHIDAGSHIGEIIIAETIETTGQVDAVAYDPVTGDLFFVIGDTLYVINMHSEDPALAIGTIPGAASGGTFINGNYYYLDVDPNSDNYLEIIEIQLTNNDDNSWTMIINDNFSGQMPYENINITDIASNGEIIYLIGRNDNQTPENYLDDVINLVYFDLNSGEWTGIIPADLIGYGGQPQIAIGADGNLYAIDVNLDGESVLRELDPTNGDHIENPADDIDVGGDDGQVIIDIGPGPLK
jgi:hypothetical protein